MSAAGRDNAGSGEVAACQFSCPGGGGFCNNQNNSAYSSIYAKYSVGGSVGWGLASASASGEAGAMSSSRNAQNTTSCPPNVTTDNSNTNISKSLMSVDQSTLIMNNTSLTSLSSSVNQMVANHMTSTTSSSNQNVMITQVLKIDINNVQGNVNISDIEQNATVDATNTISMDLSAIDNVRTDLANGVLQQFSAASNTDSINAAQASIDKELSAANEAAVDMQQKKKITQTQKTDIPMAMPTTVQSPEPGANVNTKQTSVQDSLTSVTISAPFTQSNNVSRTIQSSILNAVTQNFTHETVTQLITAININQAMGFSISNIVGNVNISNIKQNASVVIKSTLDQHLNIGTAIVNSMSGSLGVSTDDKVAIKKSNSATLKDTAKLRASNTSSTKQSSDFSYEQSITQSIVPSSGSSGSSCSSCCILVLIIFIAPMLFSALPNISSENSEEYIDEDTDEDKESSSNSETAELPTNKGGYYFY
jgi:hypothetical protein